MCKLPLRAAAVLAAAVSLTIVSSAQAPGPSADERRNPFGGDRDAVRQGAVLFRQECVFCHGVGARGGARGPDLTTGSWSHGGGDPELFRTISDGVPGTAMPAHHLTDEEIWRIVSYLRNEQQPAAASAGNASRGEMLFFENDRCSRCHIVGGRGGRLGPELSHVGSARPRAYLVESIREPSRQLADNRTLGGGATLKYDTVAAVTADGKTVIGVPMDEDTFTIQIMDANEGVHSFEKKSLKSLRHDDRSLMPAYGANALSDADLQDIVSYLQSLRAPSPAPEKGAKRAQQ